MHRARPQSDAASCHGVAAYRAPMPSAEPWPSAQTITASDARRHLWSRASGAHCRTQNQRHDHLRRGGV